MDSIAKEILTHRIKSKNALFFQECMESILQEIFGIEFETIKQKHDKGCDGIIENNTAIALYGPEKYVLRDFKKKVLSDHKSYSKNWKTTHPKWLVICNCEITAEMKSCVTSVEPDGRLWGVNEIVTLISKSNWTTKTRIFRNLGIEDHYISVDVIKMIIEDLILAIDFPPTTPYKKPLYIVEKVNLNMTQEQAKPFLEEYEECLLEFHTITSALQSIESAKVLALRSKIRNAYMRLSGTFLERIEYMIENFAGQKFEDDVYVRNLRLLLIYFFEQCLFGIRTPNEIPHNA